MGLHPSEILIGYEKAGQFLYKEFENQTCYTCQDIRDNAEVEKCIKASVASKMYGLEDLLAKLIT